MQERVRVEMEVKGGELRQVKERWQVRENEWFQASMALEREAEVPCLSPLPPSLPPSISLSLSLSHTHTHAHSLIS